MRGFCRAFCIVSFSAVCLFSARTHADVSKGRQHIAQGEYAAANRVLREVEGADRERAQLELVKVAALTGHYKAGIQQAQGLLKAPVVQLEAHVLLASLYRSTGRYKQARSLLLPQAARHPEDLATRHALALAHEDMGQSKEARVLWNQFFDDYAAKKLDLNNAQHLFFVAEAAQHLNSFEDSNDSYHEALEIDGNFHQANVQVGHLFLRKYAPGDAITSFEEVLKRNPKHADALAGLAKAKVEAAYDVAGALEYVEKTLAVNASHVGALLVRAGLEIDKNEWGKAKATIAAALQVNPESFAARAHMATVYWLREDMAQYEREKKRVFAINPEFGEFFHIVMRSAEREHRYRQAVELGKEAVAVNGDDYEAMQLIGTGYLRLGNEKEGVKWLRKAWRGDQFNLRTLNTLDLFEKHIPRLYEFVTSKNFKVRYHKDERAIYDRHITPTLERAFADMVKRYGFTPKTPVVVELYQNPEHYSVRTVGLPNLGALGVCFGQVITAMSPSVGDLNWGMVLWHELSHVFAIQLSESKVPRWFTEGLSEYETILARPEWRRENDGDLWAALKDGKLPTTVELNYGFMKPSVQEVVVAYHLSSVTIEYLVANYGFAVIPRALKRFAKGQETAEVIPAITGKSMADFDREFREHLYRRLAAYKGSFHLPRLGNDLAGLAEAAKKAPQSAEAKARLALGYFYAGDAERAVETAQAAQALAPSNPIARYVLAEMALQKRDAETATKLFRSLVAGGHDNFDIRVRLSMLASGRKDKEAFVGHLQTAKALDPERSYPYETLAEYYFAEKNTARALQELETYVMIEQSSFSHLKTLIEEYGKQKKWQKVIHFGELALQLNPASGFVQLALGNAYLESGNTTGALYAYDSALVIRPRLRRPALAHIGRAKAFELQENKKLARRAINAALELEPENARALKLKTRLR